jgi:hypothetical protein
MVTRVPHFSRPLREVGPVQNNRSTCHQIPRPDTKAAKRPRLQIGVEQN